MWGVAMSALTILVAVAVALGKISSFYLTIPFIASTTARRFGVTPMDASIDADGLWLGDTLAAPRADIVDAWADPDDTDHRVSIAVKADELLVLHLPNAEQAKRFAKELAPKAAERVVVGHRPRAIDAVYPLRLLAVTGMLLATAGWKNPPAVLLLILFALGAYGFVVATQIESGPDGLTLRQFARERHIPWSDVTEDLLAKLPARVVRSVLLSTSPWTKHAHARVIAHARAELTKRK
jgi:hypothetical protein